MNKAIIIGRLVRDPEVRYTQEQNMCVARYTIAVNRRNDEVDFIDCVAFGKAGEFAEKYLKQGTKMCVTGRIATGSYTNKDGHKVKTWEIAVEDQEFCEKRADAPAEQVKPQPNSGFTPLSGFDTPPFV